MYPAQYLATISKTIISTRYSCGYVYTNPNSRLRSLKGTSKSGHEPCQLRLANVVIGDLFRGAETQLP